MEERVMHRGNTRVNDKGRGDHEEVNEERRFRQQMIGIQKLKKNIDFGVNEKKGRVD